MKENYLGYFSLFTPVAIVLALLSGGMGHGNYFFANLFFPYTMLSSLLTGTVSTGAIIFSVVQFPLYGGILDAAERKNRFRATLSTMAGIHGIAVICALLFLKEFYG